MFVLKEATTRERGRIALAEIEASVAARLGPGRIRALLIELLAESLHLGIELVLNPESDSVGRRTHWLVSRPHR
jgi:hypothetical protein